MVFVILGRELASGVITADMSDPQEGWLRLEGDFMLVPDISADDNGISCAPP